jgi:hypothetical protein
MGSQATRSTDALGRYLSGHQRSNVAAEGKADAD